MLQINDEPNDATGANVPLAGEGDTELTQEEAAILADDPEANATDAAVSDPAVKL